MLRIFRCNLCFKSEKLAQNWKIYAAYNAGVVDTKTTHPAPHLLFHFTLWHFMTVSLDFLNVSSISLHNRNRWFGYLEARIVIHNCFLKYQSRRQLAGPFNSRHLLLINDSVVSRWTIATFIHAIKTKVSFLLVMFSVLPLFSFSRTEWQDNDFPVKCQESDAKCSISNQQVIKHRSTSHNVVPTATWSLHTSTERCRNCI